MRLHCRGIESPGFFWLERSIRVFRSAAKVELCPPGLVDAEILEGNAPALPRR